MSLLFPGANNTWISAMNEVVPVQLMVAGKVHYNGTVKEIHQQIVITDFRTDLDGSEFEVKVTYCESMKQNDQFIIKSA